MKHIVIRRCMIVTLIGMVALYTVRAAARENGSLTEIEEFANAVLSLTPVQTLRISVANPLEQAAPARECVLSWRLGRPAASISPGARAPVRRQRRIARAERRGDHRARRVPFL